MSTVLKQINQHFSAMERLVAPSLVQIRSGQHGVGSGVVWRADGLIITNAHVVRHGSVMVQTADQAELEARILASDAHWDIALLQIDATKLSPVRLGNSDQLHSGDIVVAFGHPWGVPGAITSGVVIGAGDDLPEWQNHGQHWLAASLHLRPGHSGGPMVDAQGRLVGINTMMNGPNVGLAVPVNRIKRFVDQSLSQNPANSEKKVQPPVFSF